MADSDKLNLGDVLQGASGVDADNVAAYLHFSYDPASNTTTINVTSLATHIGDAAASMDEKIILRDFNVTVPGTNDQHIIHNLLTHARLMAN